MADVCPFPGVRYNEALVGDLAAVICPPYDIITPQMQRELYQRSQYNFVRLEFGQESPGEAVENKYARAAATFQRWLEQGVLVSDETPAIYLHDHYFSHQGREYRRRGLIARVRLEEWDKGIVRPHEGTLTEPKGDRLNLLRALRANTSPILALFHDRGKRISSLLAGQEKRQPLLSFSTADGERHKLWTLTEAEVIGEIRRSLADEPLYIADGHHRYESALAYQRERRAGAASGEEGFDFVMMTLVDLADPGLIILPPHRLVRGVAKSALDGLLAKLKMLFEIEELPLSSPDVWQRSGNLLSGETSQVGLALFGLAGGNLLLLKPGDFEAIGRMMPAAHSEIYQRLDVSIVDHVILEKLLGLSLDRGGPFLAYSYDMRDALNRVRAQDYQLACLLRPVRAEVIKAIADAGDRMPRKSTYFYPKLPSGLLLYRMG
ncbi:MAG TPA: DUF1015 domain-containing protein [Dehalococcoidia bacterium]|nr:DUF1015 domain-containing protein [Dehalococcoidia bacterium]